MVTKIIRRFDWNLLLVTLALAAIGVAAVYSATFDSPHADLFAKQLVWVAIGIVLMFAFLALDYYIILELSLPLYIFGVSLLAYVLFFGKVIAGTRAWISIGGFQLQPSEFAKVTTALLLARFFDEHDEAYLSWRTFAMMAGIVLLPVALIAAEPDFGTAATLLPLAAAGMFFGGVPWRVWVVLALAALLVLPGGWFLLKDYQKERILTFLQPERDPLGAGYQVMQSKIAVGSGGTVGKGFRAGTQSQLKFLPEQHTDFIFSVVAEERGFLGVAIVLGLYLYLLVHSLSIAKAARDRGGAFLILGLLAIFGFHIVFNIGMVIGLFPTTGIPLPLLSYGGSSTLTNFAAIGLILNVEFRRFVNV